MADDITSKNIEAEALAVAEALLKVRRQTLDKVLEEKNLEKEILEYTKLRNISYNQRTKTIGSINKELTLSKEIESELYLLSSRKYALEYDMNQTLLDIAEKQRYLTTGRLEDEIKQHLILQKSAALQAERGNISEEEFKRRQEAITKELKPITERLSLITNENNEYENQIKKLEEIFKQSLTILEADRKRTKELELQQAKLNAQFNLADKLAGGFISKFKNSDISKIIGLEKFLNKLEGGKAVAIGFVTGVVKKGIDNFLLFDKAATQVRKNLGLLRGEAQKIEENIKRITLESMKLGGSFEQTAKTVKEIAEAFTVYSSENKKFVETINLLSIQLEIAASESAEFLKTMGGIKNESAEANLYMLGFARKVAQASGIPLSTLMKDTATAARNSSAYIKPYAEYMTIAAAKARMMGTTLENMASTSRRLLDFQSSIQDELEASVLLGRNVNFQRARELSYRKDTLAANEEILRQVKRYRFDMMDPLQMEAFAKAAGKTVGELQDMFEASKRMDELERMSLIDEKLKTRLNALKQMQDMRKEEAKDLGKQALLELERTENQERIASLQQKFNAFLSKVSEPAMRLAEVLLEIATEILPPILNGMLGIIETFKIIAAIDFFKGIDISVLKTFKLLFSFTTFFSGLKILFIEPFNILSNIVSYVAKSITSIDTSFRKIQILILKMFKDIENIFSSIITSIQNKIKSIKFPFVVEIKKIFDELKNLKFFTNTIPAVISKIKSFFAVLKGIKFLNFFSELKDITKFVLTLVEELFIAVKNSKFIKFFTESIPKIISKITPLFSTLGETFKIFKFFKFFSKAIPFVGQIIMAIEALYITFKRGKDIIGNFMDGFKEIFSGNILTGIGLIGKGMLKALLLPAELIVGVVGGAIYDLVQLLLGWMGVELPEGIWNGIRSLGDKIFDSILSPFKSAWEWIKGIYVGKSPSFLAEGILKGIISIGSAIKNALLEPFKSPEKIILFLLKLPFLGLINWLPSILKNSIVNKLIDSFKFVKNKISEYLKDSFNQMYEYGMSKFSELTDGIKETPIVYNVPIVGNIKMANNLVEKIFDLFSSKKKEMSNNISQPITDGLNDAANRSKDSYNKMTNGLKAVSPEIKNSLTKPFSDAYDDVNEDWGGKSPSKIGNSILLGIQSIIESMYNSLMQPFKSASLNVNSEFTDGVINSILTGMEDIQPSIYNSLITPFIGGFNFIKSTISNLLNNISKNNIYDAINNQPNESFFDSIKTSIFSTINESFNLISTLSSYISESIIAGIQNSQIEIYYNLVDPFIIAFEFIESKWYDLIDSMKLSIDFDSVINNQIELYNSLLTQFINVVYLIEEKLNNLSEILIDQKNRISNNFIDNSMFNNLIDTLSNTFEKLINEISNSIVNKITTVGSDILNISFDSFSNFSNEIGKSIDEGIATIQSNIYNSLIQPFLDAFDLIGRELINLNNKFTISLNFDEEIEKTESKLNKFIKQPFDNIITDANKNLSSLTKNLITPININFILNGLNNISEILYTSLINPVQSTFNVLKNEYNKILNEIAKSIQTTAGKNKIKPIETDKMLNKSFYDTADDMKIKWNELLSNLSNKPLKINDSFKNQIENFTSHLELIKTKINDVYTQPLKLDNNFISHLDLIKTKINEIAKQPITFNENIVNESFFNKLIEVFDLGVANLTTQFRDFITLESDYLYFEIYNALLESFNDAFEQILLNSEETILNLSNKIKLINIDFIGENLINNIISLFENTISYFSNTLSENILNSIINIQDSLYLALISPFEQGFEWIKNNWTDTLSFLINKSITSTVNIIDELVLTKLVNSLDIISNLYSKNKNDNILSSLSNELNSVLKSLTNTIDSSLPKLINSFDKLININFSNITTDILQLSNAVNTFSTSIPKMSTGFDTKLSDGLYLLSGLAPSIERTNVGLSSIGDDLLIFKDKEIVDGINNITDAINKLNEAVTNVNQIKLKTSTPTNEQVDVKKNANTTDNKIVAKLDEFISLMKNGAISVNMDGIKTGQLMTSAAKYRS